VTRDSPTGDSGTGQEGREDRPDDRELKHGEGGKGEPQWDGYVLTQAQHST